MKLAIYSCDYSTARRLAVYLIAYDMWFTHNASADSEGSKHEIAVGAEDAAFVQSFFAQNLEYTAVEEFREI